MRSKQRGTLAEGMLVFLLCIMVAGVLVGLVIGGHAVKCHAQWGGAGFDEVKYAVPGGCMVKRAGRWFPTSAIRDLNV